MSRGSLDAAASVCRLAPTVQQQRDAQQTPDHHVTVLGLHGKFVNQRFQQATLEPSACIDHGRVLVYPECSGILGTDEEGRQWLTVALHCHIQMAVVVLVYIIFNRRG